MRRLGRFGKLKQKGKDAAKDYYFKTFGERENGTWKAPCQSCQRPIWRKESDSHHIDKSSARGGREGGGEELPNMLCLCGRCHGFIHADDERLAWVAAQECNMENGRFLEWPEGEAAKLADWKLNWR